MRYFLDIAYDGTNYAGWQIQPNAMTVQEELNRALSVLWRADVQTLGAGRTDAGVHARQLMVQVEGPEELHTDTAHRLNGILAADVAVNEIYVPRNQELHARFDATARAYTYQLTVKKSVHHRHQAMKIRKMPDLEAMQAAADSLKAYTEFGAFCKAHGANKTNTCSITRAEWEVTDELLLFHIEADRFLRGMVRAIVGSLLLVGRGDWSVEKFQSVIESGERSQAGPSAEAKGLFLVKVAYPEGAFFKVSLTHQYRFHEE